MDVYEPETEPDAGALPSRVPAQYPNLTKAGRGRLPGVPNKRTIAVKDAILTVYEDLQASESEEVANAHFLKWAQANPTHFYRIFVKLLPRELRSEAYSHVVGEVIFKGLND